MTGNQLVRRWVFYTRADWDRFIAFMGQNLKPMADQSRFLQCVVSEYKESRSSAANAYMWAGILMPVSEQAFVGGQRFKPEVWSEHLKELFLPEINARGMDKWMVLPNGNRRLVMGTSNLNTAEMALYLDQCAAYAATELGVQLPANPRDQPEDRR